MDNTLKIVQINCNKSKTATAEILKYSRDNNIHLMFLQEPYTAKTKNKNEYKIPDTTNLITASVKQEQFLSTIICVNTKINNLELNPIYFPQFSTKYLTLIAIEINKTQIFCLNVYLPPQANITPIISEIDKILEFTLGKRVIICGDFNCRSNTWFDRINDARSQTIEEFITTNNLILENQPNNLPTFQSPRGESNIDLTIVSALPAVNINNWKTTNATSSDHNLITFDVGGDFLPAAHTSPASKFKMDPDAIKDEILQPCITDLINRLNVAHPTINSPQEIEHTTDALYQGIDEIIRTHGKKRKKFVGRPDWWNEELDRFRKIYLAKKSLFYKNKLREYSDHLHTEMTTAKEKFKLKMEKQRRKSWDKFAEDDLTRDPWGVVYKLAAEKFKGRGILHSFQTDEGEPTRNHITTMTYLINNLLPDDDPTINDEEQRITYGDYRAITGERGRYLEVNEDEVNHLVSLIKNKKAPGLDNLKGKILKRLHPAITPFLVKIINACFSFSYFPRRWKKGKLVILLKDPNASHTSIKNYRPITLLPEHGKIMEKIVRKAVEAELTPLHSRHQYGFIKGRSTTDALERFVSTVRNANEKYVATIYFDIRGAFDNLWWPALIKTLKARGVSSELTAMIKSYLTDREVEFTQGSETVRKLCTKGCPQGSVLGPTLWNLIMDTLLDSEWPNYATPIAYADDLAVIVKSNLRPELKANLQSITDKITNWAAHNKLSVSEAKTKIMIHKCPPRVHHRDLNIKILGQKIALVKTQKYLGIVIDSKLQFESHASYSARKARQITMGLRNFAARRFGQTSETSLRTIYHRAIVPILSYGSRIWKDRLHLEKNRRQYLSAQAPINRILSKSYASVSKEAAAVLAGNLPMDLEIEIRNCLSEIKHGRNVTFLGEIITPNTFDSRHHCKEYINLRAIDCWQSRWEAAPKGRTTFQFVPDVYRRLTGPEINFSHNKTQVLTGHGNFNIHQERLGKSENGHCQSCFNIDDDPIHRILDCPNFEEARNKLRASLNWPPDLTLVPYLEDDTIFEMLAKSDTV
jgi:hypothetical protein